MLRQWWFNKRLGPVLSRMEKRIDTPTLAALYRDFRPEWTAPYMPRMGRSIELQVYSSNVIELADNITKANELMSVNAYVDLKNTNQIKTIRLDDFLVDKHDRPVALGSAMMGLEQRLSKFEALIGDSGRHNYYKRQFFRIESDLREMLAGWHILSF